MPCLMHLWFLSLHMCIMSVSTKETALRQELQKVDQQLRTEMEELQHVQHLVQEFDPPFIPLVRVISKFNPRRVGSKPIVTNPSNKASNYH